MPTPPPPGTNFWTINAANLTGGSDGIKLVGCHIVQDVNFYTFRQPDWTILAQSTTIGLPVTAFSFPQFAYKDIVSWTINMAAPPTDPKQSWGVDSWSFPPQPMIDDDGPGQSGEFTAQAGSGLPVDEAASSAKA